LTLHIVYVVLSGKWNMKHVGYILVKSWLWNQSIWPSQNWLW